ncbi:MAG: FAD-linked oxidase C-terminal domain-containing protein [Candidatus Gastranaerophilaceae bacterium]|nr:FAD-linked oxidase C-terminal domain-containing protein [Candidatus Gastranaerophilaceae bacterium]
MSTSTENFIKEIKSELSSDNVLSTKEECYAYAQDASNSRVITNIPDAVVFVRSKEDVIEVVNKARKYGVPIICRGAGTNTVGACRVEHGGIILNFSKMNKILEINKQNMTAKVQPGVILGDLLEELEKIGLFYPPDPSNLKVSTIGGSIAQASGGAKTFKYGSTKNYVLNLEVVTANGEIIKTGSDTVKNATGYNLTSLFVGSEGTLGIITEAVLKLIPKPEATKVIMAYFDTVEDAVSAVDMIIDEKIMPATIDFMDKNAINTVEKFYPAGLLCDKDAALVIEIDGMAESIDYQQKIIENILKRCRASAIQVSHSEEEYDRIWMARRSSMGACAKLKPNVTTDDVIVPRQNLAKLVYGIREICNKYNLTSCLVGHVGDGSVHPQIPIDYRDEDEYRRFKLAKSEIYDLAASLGGIISGEHGIGADKRQYISKVVSKTSLDYMREIKRVFDPNNILNPYKIF